MDGFSTQEGVVVLAGTNRADILDAAILRPGRFDRQIMVDKPDIRGRKDVFMVYLEKLTLDEAMDTEHYAQRLAALTPGFAGAEIANICNEAAIIAARRTADFVTMDDFEGAVDRVIGGSVARAAATLPPCPCARGRPAHPIAASPAAAPHPPLPHRPHLHAPPSLARLASAARRIARHIIPGLR